ncbi:S1C family serine protease [Cellulosimicrobium arenosum]|uniref:Trypsin-like peptidase domain-containing protein n=1 Tax=Cellulosimicrobium arenosum TaxID=2708133 RepID=A0A927G7E3_9MICO|nr:trypsin-like peptidase domain-containing protein [Cellulosimicrobium arenosum]MBD8078108.1 trypsin-like peptidase domain-containing protein [Cellulosimicrobium arenosum]
MTDHWNGHDRARDVTTPGAGAGPQAPNPFAPPSAYRSAAHEQHAPVPPPPGLAPPVYPATPPAPPRSVDPTLVAAPPRPGARRGLRPGAVAGLAVLALGAGLVGGVAADRLVGPSTSTVASSTLPPATVEPQVDRPDGSVADIAATVLPSVVSLQVAGADGVATGSGFVLRQDGYILTNNHVVAGGADGGDIVVLFADGHESPAELVGRTIDYDLAVVKVEDTGLTPLELGDSDGVLVGDPVVAVGAPLGLNGTVTTGIVSALNRPVQAGEAADTAFINALQTDAAINPGNSGGPLVNGSGQVVGINSAIAQPPGAAQATGSIGLGFAIPSNQARRTAEQLIADGVATYPVIGVLLDPRYRGEGVQVTRQPQQGQPAVTPDGPADAAGIRPGDVILAIDGRPVTESDELIVAIRALAPGDVVTLQVRTGEQERDVRVVLDEATSE